MPLPKSNELNFENSIATIRWESGFKSTHQDGEKAVVLSLNSLTVKEQQLVFRLLLVPYCSPMCIWQIFMFGALCNHYYVVKSTILLLCTQLLFIYLHFLLFIHVSCVIGRRFCCHTFVPADSYSGIYMSLATYRMPHQHESLSHSLSLEYTKKPKKQCHPEAFQKINYKHFQSSHTEDVPVVEKCTEFYIHWSCYFTIITRAG